MDEETSTIEVSATQALAAELRAVSGRLKRRLREQTHLGELSWSQVAVLGRLERDGPATVSMLARAEGMRPQSMGTIIAALEAAGHIRGTPDPADGRQTILSVTPQSMQWIRAARAAREDWLAGTITAQLTADEQRELAHALDLLKRIADS